MSEINIRRDEQDALDKIVPDDLDKLIDQAIRDESAAALHSLSLGRCGPYVANQFRTFEQALTEYSASRSAKKRTETLDRVQRASYKLSSAVSAMKHRLEAEREEGQLFFVDDQIPAPGHFSKRLSVRIGYRWRLEASGAWTFGDITFFHDADVRPGYAAIQPKRKPSAAKQEMDLQYQLYQTWEYLMRGALHSVRDYLREGRDRNAIPKTFQAKTDPYSRDLNNHSTKFWIDES